MKVYQTWHRNAPSTSGEYSITVKYTYVSNNPSEIDEIERKMPNGMLVIDTENSPRRSNVLNCGGEKNDEK